MIYAGIWALVVIMQSVVVYLVSTDLPFGYIFVDSVVFCFILACIIILIWYPVRFKQWERRTWHFNLAAHFTLAGMTVACWLLIGYGFCFLTGLTNTEYRHFLIISLWWKTLEGILFYIFAILVYFLYIHVEQLKEKAENEIHLNRLIRDGELNLLKSQINPHFLFNSMNSVNSLINRNPEQAQKMLVALSDYMRYAVLSTKCEYSNVTDEMENIARYLSIEQLRFGDKLLYEPSIDASCHTVEIPAMLLQPLFENAIKHGVYESLETVRIVAKITKDRQYVNIEISNDFDEEGVSQKKGSGTGLQNIHERLRLLYGTSATMQTKAENGVFMVIVKIPLMHRV
jgi:sensor histidine kinase YesM